MADADATRARVTGKGTPVVVPGRGYQREIPPASWHPSLVLVAGLEAQLLGVNRFWVGYEPTGRPTTRILSLRLAPARVFGK